MTATKPVRLRIKATLPNLTRKEQLIGRFILEHPIEASRMTINEMSSHLNMADSTIFKFTQSLGYNGFREFRNDLLADAYDPQISVHENVHPNDSAADIAQVVFQSSIKSLTDTRNLLDAKALEKAVDIILESNRMSFHGFGGSNSVAYDAYLKFLHSAKPCVYVMDYHVQLIQATRLGEHDCALLITHTGLTKEIIQIAKALKQGGTRIIAITSYPTAYLKEYADVILVSLSEETGYRSESLSSRIAQLAIIDSIYTAVMFRAPGVQASLHTMRQAIAPTKFDDTL